MNTSLLTHNLLETVKKRYVCTSQVEVQTFTSEWVPRGNKISAHNATSYLATAPLFCTTL